MTSTVWRKHAESIPGINLTGQITKILHEEVPRACFVITESQWVGAYKRMCVTFDIGERRPLQVYLTQDGERDWKAASFVAGGVCFERGSSPAILRKLIAREALISRLRY